MLTVREKRSFLVDLNVNLTLYFFTTGDLFFDGVQCSYTTLMHVFQNKKREMNIKKKT